MVKIKKVITVSAIALLGVSGTAFAEGNETSIEDQIIIDDIEDAGYTPDNTIMYKFDRFGDWTKLQFARLGGEEEYDRVENEVLQERLAELKLVNEDNREEFKEQIEAQIQDRKERQEQKLDELKEQIEERKAEKRSGNETSTEDDEELEELEKQIQEKLADIEKDDNEIRKNLKEVEFERAKELAKLQEKFEEHQADVRELNRDSDDFMEENKELFEKYGSIIESFEGDSFKISTDERELVGEIRDGKVNFLDTDEGVKYEIKVRSEEQLREQIESGETDLEKIEDNVDVPLTLKTKIAYNIATYDGEESEESE